MTTTLIILVITVAPFIWGDDSDVFAGADRYHADRLRNVGGNKQDHQRGNETITLIAAMLNPVYRRLS